MHALAVIIEEPGRVALREVALSEAGEQDVVVDMTWSGISTGTERLLWSGRMPHFPGMGYPLIPGYESVGRVTSAGRDSGRRSGETVFVPGARCFGDVRGLFGGAASRVVVPGARVHPVAEGLRERAVLLALAATAHHALATSRAGQIDLIVGHGVLGRLIARLCSALRPETPPVVWEANPTRRAGASGYRVIAPADDDASYATVCDVSGDPGILDQLISRLKPGGEIVLAGFYDRPLSFAFPPAFMCEAHISVAAQWKPGDLASVGSLIADEMLSLDDLITHRRSADEAADAYDTAFNDPACLKMVLDWRHYR